MPAHGFDLIPRQQNKERLESSVFQAYASESNAGYFQVSASEKQIRLFRHILGRTTSLYRTLHETGEYSTNFPSRIDADQSVHARERFYRHKRELDEQSSPMMEPTEIAMLPAYQKVIGMGKEALPFILSELRSEVSHWFWALSAISDDDPVPEAQKGDMMAMRDAWLDWGIVHGYVRRG